MPIKILKADAKYIKEMKSITLCGREDGEIYFYFG